MTLFEEIYQDNRTFSFRHNGPTTHINARNIAIDDYRHHDKRKVRVFGDDDVRYKNDDFEWRRIELRDFFDVLISRIKEEGELKILVVLLKVYQLDEYVGSDLFEWYDFYMSLSIDEDIVRKAIEKRAVSKYIVADLCGFSTKDKSLKSYHKHLHNLGVQMKDMGVSTEDLFRDTMTLGFTPYKIMKTTLEDEDNYCWNEED